MNHYDLLNSECLNYQVRKLSRVLTILLDEAMLIKGGLRYTQFSLMVSIASLDGGTITSLAKKTHMDRTTITRNLKPLKVRGWVEVVQALDLRSKTIRLTKVGHLVLEEAMPIWQGVVNSMVDTTGKDLYCECLGLLKSLIARFEV